MCSIHLFLLWARPCSAKVGHFYDFLNSMLLVSPVFNAFFTFLYCNDALPAVISRRSYADLAVGLYCQVPGEVEKSLPRLKMGVKTVDQSHLSIYQ